jgi:exoribonuclease-2
VHIAAPALGLRPQSAAARIARQRLSTVYYPGNKITMLPPSVVQQYSLAEGGPRPALSFYMTVRENSVAAEALVQGGEAPSRFVIEQEHSVIERVPVLANLRHQDIGELDSAFPEGRVPAQLPQAPAADSAALYWLWQFAGWLEQSRGRAGVTQERPDFNFSLEPDVPPDLARISITTRSRGTPLDKLVAELMIRVNHAWGKLLDEHQVAAIYRSQGGGKVRMSSTAAPHQGLGISHYAWSSSPLRRYVDLLNQWQLLALLRGEAAPFARNDETLLAAIHDFESTYAAYGEFQDRMERYWCLRWLQQEGVQHLVAEVVRDNLVRLDCLPLYARIAGLPEFHPGHRVELLLGEIDLLDAELSLIYHRSLSPEITEIV